MTDPANRVFGRFRPFVELFPVLCIPKYTKAFSTPAIGAKLIFEPDGGFSRANVVGFIRQDLRGPKMILSHSP